MVKEVKWTKYLWLSLLSFGGFMLEFLSIFGIEVIFLHVDIQNYTMHQRSIHCIIMVFIWAFFISVLLIFSRKYYHFPISGNKREKISLKNWIVILACFIGCDMGSVSFRIKRSRTWNMERNFYYDIFCS